MMRAGLVALMLLLGACARGAENCDITLTRSISFTSAEAADTITVRTIGPDCANTIGLFEIRGADGRPLWAWTAPLEHAFGDAFAPDEPDAMRAFLERWAAPALADTSAAPAYDALAPGRTTLDQLTYEDIRARTLPMLCHASAQGEETCIFYEPVAGGAGQLFNRDMESGDMESGAE